MRPVLTATLVLERPAADNRMMTRPALLRVARAATLALFTFAAAGCGSSSPSVLMRAHGQVIGIALDGDRVAWATSGDCRPHVYMREGGSDHAVSLPRPVSRYSECFTNAKLVLSGSNVGWFFLDQGGNSSSFASGASSWKPTRTTTFADETYAIDLPVLGATFAGLASDGGRVLWGWAHVSFRDPENVGTCDLSTSEPGCQTRTDGGGIRTWSGGHTGFVSGIPPVQTLLGGEDWIAMVPEPRTSWIHGGPRLGAIRGLRLSDRQAVRVPRSSFGGPVAVSHTMLAVLRDAGAFALYGLPAGGLIRGVKVADWVYPMAFCAGTTFVVETDENHLLFVDAETGRRSVFAVADPSRNSISAVAVDGSRVAWAEYDWKSRTSVVRVRTVS
jgi:hypothetical protein